METPWEQIGIAGILIVIILREVFNFLRSRNGNGHATAWALEYSREFGSMTTEMRKLNHSIAQLSQTLNCLSHEAKATRAQVKEVRKDIEELDRRLSK